MKQLKNWVPLTPRDVPRTIFIFAQSILLWASMQLFRHEVWIKWILWANNTGSQVCTSLLVYQPPSNNPSPASLARSNRTCEWSRRSACRPCRWPQRWWCCWSQWTQGSLQRWHIEYDGHQGPWKKQTKLNQIIQYSFITRTRLFCGTWAPLARRPSAWIDPWWRSKWWSAQHWSKSQSHMLSQTTAKSPSCPTRVVQRGSKSLGIGAAMNRRYS